MDDDIRNEDGRTSAYHVGAKLTGDEAKTAASMFRKSTTAGAGLGKMAKGTTGMPRQKEGETATEFGARMREWRASNPVIEGQKKALTALAPK